MNVYEFAQAASILKFHNPRYLGEQRIVASNPHIQTRFELGPPLTDDNGAAIHKLAGKTLYSKPFRLAIPSIPGTSNSLFMCHADLLACYIYFFNADF
jgi:hypothetical protein